MTVCLTRGKQRSSLERGTSSFYMYAVMWTSLMTMHLAWSAPYSLPHILNTNECILAGPILLPLWPCLSCGPGGVPLVLCSGLARTALNPYLQVCRKLSKLSKLSKLKWKHPSDPTPTPTCLSITAPLFLTSMESWR